MVRIVVGRHMAAIVDLDRGKDTESFEREGKLWFVMDSKPTDLLREMGRVAMNAQPLKLDRRSSKESTVKKLHATEKPSARNPLKELNSGCFPPPLGSDKAFNGASFRFLLSDSSTKESSSQSKPVLRTPRSAPRIRVNAAFNPKNSTNLSRGRTSQNTASKSNLELAKQLGSRKPSKPKPSYFLQRWSKRKPSSNVRNTNPNVDFDEGHEGSRLAPSPERTLQGFDAYAGVEVARAAEQKLTSTPTLATTPPVQASISPEVSMEACVLAAAAVCFAKGHVVAGVHDRRKCKPRGILTIGGTEPETKNVHDGVNDPTRVSMSPPPLAGASIHWLSSPSENIDSILCRSYGSNSRVHLAQSPAEASVDWLIPPREDGQTMLKKVFVRGSTPPSDHTCWRFSVNNSVCGKSPQLGSLLGFNSFGLETTLPSGFGIQKTPTADGSFSLPSDEEAVPQYEFLKRSTPPSDHTFWRFSPNISVSGKSSQLVGFLGLNSCSLGTTPSSGVGIHKTPSTGGTFNPPSDGQSVPQDEFLKGSTPPSDHTFRRFSPNNHVSGKSSQLVSLLGLNSCGLDTRPSPGIGFQKIPSTGSRQAEAKDDYLKGSSPPSDHTFWSFSPNNSISRKSSQFVGLLSLNSFGSETTPSSGIGIQRTPSSGDSVSPFSLILDRIAKKSESRHLRPQPERPDRRHRSASESSQSYENSLIEGCVICTPPSYNSSSSKNYNLSDLKMNEMACAHLENDSSCQTTSTAPSLQFEYSEAPSNSVDLGHFHYPSSCDTFSMLDRIPSKENCLPSSQRRISWKEGLVSRIFEMGELDCYQWISDDEDNLNHHEENRVGLIAEFTFENQTCGSLTKSQHERNAAVGFGYIEFALEAEGSSAKVPLHGPSSFAESITMEELALDSSDASDWKFSFKNHLFEE